MRLPRWAPWVEDVLKGSPAITAVKPFADAGITDLKFGHVITLRTGAQIALQWVRTSPPSGDQPEEEAVATGEPPAAQTLPELPGSGRTPLALVEEHIAALIANGGNAEIRAVERKSVRDDAGLRPCCVIVRMHNGADVFGVFRSMAPAGANLTSGGDFQQREEV